MNILLKKANIITQNKKREIFTGDIWIENNRIKEVASNIANPGIEEMNLEGLTIIPGLIQSHVHLCQTLFRNLADDLELLDWLETRIWPMEMSHNEDSLRVAAQLGLYEMLSSGVTSILDMGCAQFQDVIFEEMQTSGIRGFSGKVIMDAGEQPYKESTREALNTTETLIKKWHGAANSRIQYALAPRFVLTCSSALWEGVKGLAKEFDLIIHTHASENRAELEYVKKITGYHNIEFFVKQNLASSKLCLAHCIWVTGQELQYLKEYQINVLHCPSANLKLASGLAPVPKMLEMNINVSLGSDGAPCNNNLDIFTDMRLAALIHKPKFGVRSLTSQQVFDMATINGAKTLGMVDRIGSIEPGKLADLTILDLNKAHTVPADSFYSQIVYSAQSKNVVHVMVDGNWVVRHGKPLAYREEEIIHNAWEQCAALLKRID